MELNPNQFTMDLQFDAPGGDMVTPPTGPRATAQQYDALRSTYFAAKKPISHRALYNGSKWADFHRR